MQNDEENSQKKIGNIYREISPYLGLGTQLAVTVVLMVFIGKWLDEYFETYPILLIIFALFGSFVGVYNFIKTVLDINKKNKDSEKNK